jgi:hypothetical protein
LFEQTRIDDVIVDRDQNRVAVGRGARGLAGTDVGARARDVLDVKLLSEMFRQFLRKEAGGRIGRTAGTERHDHAHRP